MKQQDLIPREPRRMKQPRKDVLREQLRLAAIELDRLRTPWWRRIFRKRT